MISVGTLSSYNESISSPEICECNVFFLFQWKIRFLRIERSKGEGPFRLHLRLAYSFYVKIHLLFWDIRLLKCVPRIHFHTPTNRQMYSHLKKIKKQNNSCLCVTRHHVLYKFFFLVCFAPSSKNNQSN